MALRPVGGLWKKTDKNGNDYLSGKIEEDIPAGTFLMIFQNKQRPGKNDPSWRMNIAEDDQPQQGQAPAKEPEPQDDDIPF